MRSTSIWRRVSATLVVAIGVAVVWGMLFLWFVTVIVTPFESGDGVREDLVVLLDGTPVIASRSVLRYDDVSYRTLEGSATEVNPQRILSGASLSAPYREPGFYYPSFGWGQALSASDYGRPANGWYLIRDNEPHGHAYFIGYDELSRRPIGYISRDGFRRALPPTEEWFDLGLSQLGWGNAIIASTGYLQYNAKAYHQPSYATDEQLPPWLVFLIDGDDLLEIDLQQRSVRPVTSAENLVSVGILRKPVFAESHLQSRVALRTADRIMLLDPNDDGTAAAEVVLPESLRDESLTVYLIGEGNLLATWTPIEYGGRTVHLAWLEPDGKISREEAVTLAGYSRGDPRWAAFAFAAAAPVPIAWAVVGGILIPISMLQYHQASTYGGALSELFSIGAPALVVVILLGLLMAWLAWHLQQKYFRPATGVWCAFVFLFGVPGFIAYWLEQRRAKLEACPECDAVVPRDREACAKCDTLFPAPAPVGTEVFA